MKENRGFSLPPAKRKFTLDVDLDALDEFEPKVREALLRLEKRQADGHGNLPGQSQAFDLNPKVVRSGIEDRRKAALQRNSRGGIEVPSRLKNPNQGDDS